jgi:Flp pilus assembly protein CpaB
MLRFDTHHWLWARRLAALGCVVLAVSSAIGGRRATGSDRRLTAVLVMTRPLPVGSTLAAADLRATTWPAELAPPNRIDAPAAAVGRRLAGPIGAGEAVTTARLVGVDLTARLAGGLVAVPVPLADPAAAPVIQPGDVVDLLAGPTAPAQAARLLAGSVLVLAVLPASEPGVDADLVVAVPVTAEESLSGAVGEEIVATLRAPP